MGRLGTFLKHIPKHAFAAAAACFAVGILFCIGAYFFFQASPEAALSKDSRCDELLQDAQLQCFVEEIMVLAQDIGITPAIDKARERLLSSPALQNECHGIMHSIGEEAYKLYKQGVPLDIDASIIMCTYGFYHGFINAAVLEEGSFEPAQAFCAYINEELSKQGIDAHSECYHGFGHAVVDDHVSTQYKTATEVTSQALELCRTLAPSSLDFINCGSGVYNAIANIFLLRSFSWPEIENDDPLLFCGNQPEELRVTCYGYFARVLFASLGSDLGDSLASIEKIVASQYQLGLIENVALIATLNKSDKKDFESFIEDCHALSSSLSGKCIGGLSVGIAQSAETGSLFESASAVCTNRSLSEQEKADCFDSLLINIKPLISRDELSSICKSLPSSSSFSSCRL
jgi:hypothetical protein